VCELKIGIFLFGILFFFFYYLWYLTWPVVTGHVTWTGAHEHQNLVRKPTKFHVVRYKYCWKEKEYVSSRQGLVFQLGFPPNAVSGDIIPIKVCKQIQSLSCPRRLLYESTVLFVIVVFCCLGLMLVMHHSCG